MADAKPNEPMTGYQIWDIVLKLIGILGIGFTAYFAFITMQKDLNAKLFENQLAVYADLCDTAFQIAESESPTKAMSLVKRFNQIMSGKLLLLEDADVMQAAHHFSVQILMDASWDKSPPAKDEDKLLPLWESQVRLTVACRKSLNKSFPKSYFGDTSVLADLDRSKVHMVLTTPDNLQELEKRLKPQNFQRKSPWGFPGAFADN
jgi:hypothetical protein